jgi:hypothetical protein
MMGGSYPYIPRWEPKPTPAQPDPPQEPNPTQQHLLRDYQNIRLDIADLERLLGTINDLSEKDLKECDKAVVLMKAGAKLIKKRLRVAGVTGKLKTHAIAGDRP